MGVVESRGGGLRDVRDVTSELDRVRAERDAAVRLLALALRVNEQTAMVLARLELRGAR